MRIAKQSGYVFLNNKDYPQKYIEAIGRICYRSEGNISENSDKKFIKMLYDNGHHAMLEHYRFILSIREDIYMALSAVAPKHFEFTNTEYEGKQRFLISFNARALINLTDDCIASHVGIIPMAIRGVQDELIGHVVKHYGCRQLFGYSDEDNLPLLSTGVDFIPNDVNCMNKSEWNKHGWFSAIMTTDRGISHEIVRHRENTSFAQESTRWCRYNNEITVIDQGFSYENRDLWIRACEIAEQTYIKMLDTGLRPEWARSVLPTCLQTTIIMTAPIYEWNHFFDLRLKGKAGNPHPLIQELAMQVYSNTQNYSFLRGGLK